MAAKSRSPAWTPPAYSLKDLDAVRAVARGEASKAEQLKAVDWIVNHSCLTYDLSFRSDADGGDRDTAFAEGRRFAGMQIVKLINMPTSFIAQMRKTDAAKKDQTNG